MLNPFTHRKILKKGRPGQAVIVERGTIDRGGTSFNLPMTLQVHVEGMPPYEVEDQWMVKAKDAIGLDGSIPVKVDPGEPTKVAIDWDGVRQKYESERVSRKVALTGQGPVDADDLAALAAGGFGAAMQPQTPSIDLRNDPELRRKIEQIVGHELTPGSSEVVAENDPEMQARILQVVQEHAAQQAAAQQPWTPAGEASSADDRVAALERLSALRASGALTEEEFQGEKKRILGA